MNEIQEILNKSAAPESVKQQVITVAFQVATPIAYQNTRGAAGGEFLTILMELLKLLLPILLELLKPKT